MNEKVQQSVSLFLDTEFDNGSSITEMVYDKPVLLAGNERGNGLQKC